MGVLTLQHVALAALFSTVLYYLFKPRRALPPGPAGWPLIGNILDMPSQHEWRTFTEWGRKWGNLVHVNLLGQHIFIVNAAEVMERFDKKGALYSDRPRLEFGGEMVGYSKTLVLMRYGPQFREMRKYIAQTFGSPSAINKFADMEQSQTIRFLRRLLANPQDLQGQLRKTSGALIMEATYGIEVQEEGDPFLKCIAIANENFSIVTAPGSFLVDIMPMLRFVPEWIPVAGNFKKIARRYAAYFNDMVELPFARTRKMMKNGTALRSFVSTSLEDELTSEAMWTIQHASASLYGGGADTTASAQAGFFLAMILWPDVQKKAQAELDSVIGGDRLPTLSDRSSLPYINAIVTEALRWHTVAPLGVPHSAMEDSIIDGYFIPKGSLIIANIWGMLHDSNVYPDPFVFDPTRFIESPDKAVQPDPRRVCFGFSRRTCPGMYLAEASLWIVVALSLTVFDISNAIEDGVPNIPIHANTTGTISHPEPFQYTLKPRSPQAISLIHDWEL